MAKPLRALGEVLNNLFTKNITSAYPKTKGKTDARYRARIKFLAEKCIGCQLCSRNCPANAIKITQINPEAKPVTDAEGKVTPPHRKFKAEIDLARCIFCAQCVESCPKSALESGQEFELAAFDRKSLKDEFDYPGEK